MRSKLSSSKRKELVIGLCRAIAALRSPEEVAEAIADLLTPREIEILAKRLQIAEYLIEGKDYNSIRSELKVGYSTIARVNTWLALSGKGYERLLTRRKKLPKPKTDEELYDPYSWHNIKRRYSAYFWPQLLLEELVRTADKKEREKIHKVLDRLELKRHRFTSKFNKDLYESFVKKL